MELAHRELAHRSDVIKKFPSLREMNWDANCQAYGRFLAAYVMPDRWNSSTPIGVSLTVTLEYFVSALPKSWKHPDPGITTPEVAGEVMQWFTEYIISYQNETDGLWYPDQEFTKRVFIDPSTSCPAEFCKAVGYTGNADLSGIGVMASYYVAAFLATLYLVAFTIWQVRHHHRERASRRSPIPGNPIRATTFAHKATDRVLDAFRGSLDEFLSNAMLLSTVMLIAAIYVAMDKMNELDNERERGQAQIISGSYIYDIILSLLAATFSVFPVMVVYALMRHPEKGEEGSHRKWLRRIMLFIMWILVATEVYIAPHGEIDYEFRHSAEERFDCDQRGGINYWRGLKASQFLVIGLPLLWIALTMFITTGFGIRGVVDKKWVRRWRHSWRLTVAWVNVAIMWGLLAYITVLRRKIRAAAGWIDSDSKWGFGQILPLATWVPVLAHFLYILVFGLEEVLSGNLPREYKAVLREQPGLEVVMVDQRPSERGDEAGLPLMGDGSPPLPPPQTPGIAPAAAAAPPPPAYSMPFGGGTGWNQGYPGGYNPGQDPTQQPIHGYNQTNQWHQQQQPLNPWNRGGW